MPTDVPMAIDIIPVRQGPIGIRATCNFSEEIESRRRISHGTDSARNRLDVTSDIDVRDLQVPIFSFLICIVKYIYKKEVSFARGRSSRKLKVHKLQGDDDTQMESPGHSDRRRHGDRPVLLRARAPRRYSFPPIYIQIYSRVQAARIGAGFKGERRRRLFSPEGRPRASVFVNEEADRLARSARHGDSGRARVAQQPRVFNTLGCR